MLSKMDLVDDGEIPVYSSDTSNNGIIGYTNREAEFIVSHENPIYLVFGDHTRSLNIVFHSFNVTDNVKVLSLKDSYSVKILLYIISILYFIDSIIKGSTIFLNFLASRVAQVIDL